MLIGPRARVIIQISSHTVISLREKIASISVGPFGFAFVTRVLSFSSSSSAAFGLCFFPLRVCVFFVPFRRDQEKATRHRTEKNRRR